VLAASFCGQRKRKKKVSEKDKRGEDTKNKEYSLLSLLIFSLSINPALRQQYRVGPSVDLLHRFLHKGSLCSVRPQ
jgi:hypothetical protein